MEQVTLNYGNQKLSLAKSHKLVAVKPEPGMHQMMEQAIGAMPQATAAGVGRAIGGFQIVELDAAPKEINAQLDALRLNPAVAAGSHVFHTSGDGVPFVPTGLLYIEFAADASTAQREALLDASKLEVQESRGADALIARVTPDSPNPIKVAAALQGSAAVKVAEPELASPGRLKAVMLPSDPLLNEQWHLRNAGYHRGTAIGFRKGADARVIDAWITSQSIGATDAIVAVIDDGFDLAHPDLSGPNKQAGAWDFTRNSPQPSPNPTAGDWHGTACAGVAVGNAGGGQIVGAAPGATLMPVRWGRYLSDGEIENWFGHVTKNGAWVVSCSWGAAASHFPLSTRATKAIEACATQGRNGKGCVVVFAAGNSNHDVNDPTGGTLDGFAIHPNVIAVAASTSRDERSNYSNFGKEISVCAPSSGAGGWGILTSDVTGTVIVNGEERALGYGPGDYTYEFGGTSSACPLVAGICALILTANPELSAAQVKQILQKTARKIGPAPGYTDGHSSQFGYGCVNAEAAIAEARAVKGAPVGLVAAAS